MTESASLPSPRMPSRMRRLLVCGAAILLVLLISGELFCRFYLGLGDPPLSVADSKIEYLCKPGSYHRFGNHFFVNQYFMRSGPLSKAKTDPSELRVMVVGDSVINGGGQTDDSQLATSLLQNRLHAALGRPVYVGNISAGSWGPPNELAYLERFGLFEADCLVLVVSSHDYADAPTFEPIVGVHPSYPDHAPLLALQELVARYIIPRITHSHDAPEPGTVAAKTPGKKDVEWCLESTRQIIRMGQEHGISVIVAQHMERGELDPNAHEHIGHILLGNAIRDEHIEPVQLGPAFKQAVDAGLNPYRDYIHPNPIGQKLIADTLYPYIYQDLKNNIGNLSTHATTIATTQLTK